MKATESIDCCLLVLYLLFCVSCASFFLSLNLMCVHAVRTHFKVTVFPSFFFCPHSDMITNLPYRSTSLKVRISPITAFTDIAYVLSVQELFCLAACAPCPLLCVRCCCVYLSIYLFVCLPVSMSLCVCLAFCLSVCTFGCLPLSVFSPSVAWASVALHEMNALFPPGFRCGVPPG